ncbi:MAG TPA: lipoyl synthase [Chitinispirillaceae bacterium]|nr:lipoyl synthase [Chitinispirillaceae bacterium]
MLTTKLDNVLNSSSTRLPGWLKRPIAYSGKHDLIHEQIQKNGLHTVCREAKCPNRGECFSRGTATFLILGENCTRNCSFCSVKHETPMPLNSNEPQLLVDAVKKMDLKHVVITSVTRDDLSDGGASVFSQIVHLIRAQLPSVTVELLIPDLLGNKDALFTIFDSGPDILNHNIETVPSLYTRIRPQAIYKRSLELLRLAASKGLVTKSGIMVGFGEKKEEVLGAMNDLREHDCSILTIGQYLQPTDRQIPVKEFITPATFDYYKSEGERMGFKAVYSGAFVRSSYRAEEYFYE